MPNQTFASPREQFATETTPIGLPWKIFVFSIVIFALSIFIYFGLRFGYGSYLDAQETSLDKNLETLSQKVSVADQARFVRLYSQISNLKTALSKHYFGSNIFKFLEKNTIGSVYFKEAMMDVTEQSLNLKGVTDSFDSLSSQTAIFEKTAEISKVTLNSVSVVGGRVDFAITLVFKENSFEKQL